MEESGEAELDGSSPLEATESTLSGGVVVGCVAGSGARTVGAADFVGMVADGV